MAYTNDRLALCESIYPVIIGNQITLLSSAVMENSALDLFSAFQLNVWITILLLFIFSIILNIIKTCKDHQKLNTSFELKDVIISLILDHILALICKRESNIYYLSLNN